MARVTPHKAARSENANSLQKGDVAVVLAGEYAGRTGVRTAGTFALLCGTQAWHGLSTGCVGPGVRKFEKGESVVVTQE